MCSLFWQMENHQGDLSDILRANSGGGGGAGGGGGGGGDGGVGGGLLGTGGINTPTTSGYGWTFPTDPAVNFPTRPGDQIDGFSSVGCGAAHGQLLQESEMMNSMFYSGDNSLLVRKDNDSYSDNPFGDSLMGQEMKPCQLLTRMIQIGPRPKIPAPANASVPSSLSSPGSKPLTDALKVNSIGGSSESASLHMNSPRNPGIKRRKSQMKKVVCIPAPAAASNRPSGEVVPSDLWAWRKYGQKPIKGSPYPRGYYRCSSSKGCSARKQVERSRNDPNMLVITYTSEHNHPWPTQRNALAGSTRSQTMKAASASKAFTPPPSRTPNAEDAVKEESIRDNVNDTENEGVCVKDEMGDVDKSMEIDDGELSQDFHESYRPTPPDLSQSDDFFSELGELEPDPLSLIFPHGLGDQKPNHEDSEDKDLDPFSLFEWSESSFSGARRGL